MQVAVVRAAFEPLVTMFHTVTRFIVAAAVVSCGAVSAHAADADEADTARIFGVLPNYNTVDRADAPKETTRQSFKLASLSTFDPVVYPFIAMTAAVGQGSSGRDYSSRYATAFADNALGNFMTTAVVSSITREDSRYYRRGEGGVFARLTYAATRSVITRTRAGAATFNIAEVAGTAAAAGVSNIYYSPADRTFSGTAGRWATQMMWDTVANELKEFWPDIRRRLGPK